MLKKVLIIASIIILLLIILFIVNNIIKKHHHKKAFATLSDEEKTSVRELKLKKARVPLRICLKLALKNMWKKKFRYLIMFIICAISLTFLSITIELNVEDEFLKENVYTMVENGYRFTNIYKADEVSEDEIKADKYNLYKSTSLPNNSYDLIKSEIDDITIHQYSPVELNYAGAQTENANYLYTGYINTLIKYDPTNNYELLAGRYPKENSKEILITDYLVSAFTYFNLFPQCNNLYDYLNIHIDLTQNKDYVVVGIIKTNYDKWTRFSNVEKVEVSDKENYAFTNDFTFMNSIILCENYFQTEKIGKTATIAFNNRPNGSSNSSGKWSVSANVNSDLMLDTSLNTAMGSLERAKVYTKEINVWYDTLGLYGDKVESCTFNRSRYNDPDTPGLRNYGITVKQSSGTAWNAVQMYYNVGSMPANTYKMTIGVFASTECNITINYKSYHLNSGMNTVEITETKEEKGSLLYTLIFGDKELGNCGNVTLKFVSFNLEYLNTYEGSTAMGFTNKDVNIIQNTGWGELYGRNVEADDEIVLPASWINSLYGFNFKTTIKDDWEQTNKQGQFWYSIEGTTIKLKLYDRNDSSISFEKEYKVVGISDSTQTIGGLASSPVVQITDKNYQDCYFTFNQSKEYIMLQLPQSSSEALTLFNNAYEKGYIIDVWAYRDDIDNYEPDPFITLASKSGLIIFAAFTMGIMWTIISIEIVDSKKEIGILRSIGLSGGKVSFIFVFQCASMIILSYFVGVAAAYKIIPLFNNGIMDEYNKIILYIYSFTYRTPVYLALFVLAMLCLSTIIPLAKIMSHKIIDVINERDN